MNFRNELDTIILPEGGIFCYKLSKCSLSLLRWNFIGHAVQRWARTLCKRISHPVTNSSIHFACKAGYAFLGGVHHLLHLTTDWSRVTCFKIISGGKYCWMSTQRFCKQLRNSLISVWLPGILKQATLYWAGGGGHFTAWHNRKPMWNAYYVDCPFSPKQILFNVLTSILIVHPRAAKFHEASVFIKTLSIPSKHVSFLWHWPNILLKCAMYVHDSIDMPWLRQPQGTPWPERML